MFASKALLHARAQHAPVARDQLAHIRRQFEQMGAGHVRVERAEHVVTWTLENARNRNALTGRMMAQLWSAADQLRAWPEVKLVVLRGQQDFFCSGGDLNTVRAIANETDGRKMALLMQSALHALQSAPALSVAAVRGAALGGGAELAAACDFRLMAPHARLGFVHVRMGIAAAWGGGTRLARLVGRQRALDLTLSGRVLSQEECARVGLCDGQLEDGDETSSAHAWLNHRYQLDARSPALVRALKRVVHAASTLEMERALQEELEAHASIWGAREHVERLAQNVKH